MPNKLNAKSLKTEMLETPEKKNPAIPALEKTTEKLKIHLSKNKHDYKTKRALLIKEARLKKLKKQ